MDPIETEDLFKPSPPPPSVFHLLLQPIQWLRRLSHQLNPSFLLGIALVYGLSFGFSASFFRVASDYYWKDVQRAPPSSAQFYAGLTYLPWILKPIWGLLTDIFPVAGYRRRPYFVAAGVASTAALAAVKGLPIGVAVVCMVGGAASMAIANVAIDAYVAKNSIEVKELAADLQSLCGFCAGVGSLIGFSTSGLCVHWLGAQGALGLLAIPPFSIFVLGFLIFEVKIINTSKFSEKVFERVGRAMKDMSRTIKFPAVWKPALFMFLSFGLSFSTHEGHFYWYTNSKVGPGFSQEFVGMMYAIGAAGSIIGVLIYHKFLKDFAFRRILFFGQLLYAMSGMLDLMFILRWNLALGIPDSFFIIMEETVLSIVSRIRCMPMIVLNTKLCPLGIEGTFFALLTSIDSLGLLCSRMIGGLVLHLFHVSRTDFTNLWLAVLIRNCLRLGTLALIFLVPDATQYDVLVPFNFSPTKSSTSESRTSSREEEAALQLVPLNERLET